MLGRTILASKHGWMLVGIGFAGFCLRIWGLDFGLPNESIPAETATLHVVLYNLLSPMMMAGDLSFHPQGFALPGLYYYFLALVFGLVYSVARTQGGISDWSALMAMAQHDPADFYLVLRVVAVVFGTALIPLAYLLGKQLENRRTGLLAAGLVAVSYLLVRVSHYGVVVMPAAFMVLLALLGLARYHRKRTPQALGGAACLVGLAVGTSYGSIALLPALWVLIMQPFWSEDRIDWLGFFKTAWKPTLMGAGVFLLTSPWALLDFSGFQAGFQQMLESYYVYDTGWTGWRFYPGTVLFYGLGGWVLFFAALGGYLSFQRVAGMNRWLHVAILAYVLGMSVLLGLMTQPRAAEAVPLATVLLVYAAMGMAYAIELLGQAPGLRGVFSGWQRWVPAGLVCVVALYQPLTMSIGIDRLMARPDTRTIARQQILSNIPPENPIATGPLIGRIYLPLQYRQLLAETGPVAPGTGEVRIARRDARTLVVSSYAHPQMFRDLEVRYVLAYEGFPPYSNNPRELEALAAGAEVVGQLDPLKQGLFEWQIALNPPRYEPFEPVYLPFTGFEHFIHPGPRVTLFDVGLSQGAQSD